MVDLALLLQEKIWKKGKMDLRMGRDVKELCKPILAGTEERYERKDCTVVSHLVENLKE